MTPPRRPTCTIVLRRLIKGRGDIVSHAALLAAIYKGEKPPRAAMRVLHQAVSRLRARGQGVIYASYGEGYWLDPNSELAKVVVPDVDDRREV
jgi:DNA-binding winged helix-turn-helix (wHTH) protein